MIKDAQVGRDTFPSWSPDGKQIAFLSLREGTSDIYVMSPLAGAPRRLAGPAFGMPQWSPDATELAYLVPAPLRRTVEIVSVVRVRFDASTFLCPSCRP